MNSLSDFAESLILGEVEGRKVGKTSIGAQPAPGMLDISETSVPTNLLKQILGEEAIPEEPVEEIQESEVEELVQEPTQGNLLTEETAQEMVSLLSEVRDLLQEMCGTGVGSIGVNLSPGPSPKKRASSRARSYLKARKAKRK